MDDDSAATVATINRSPFGPDAQFLYSRAQNRYLALIPSCLAPFSVLGSSLIVYTILKGRRKRRSLRESRPTPPPRPQLEPASPLAQSPQCPPSSSSASSSHDPTTKATSRRRFFGCLSWCGWGSISSSSSRNSTNDDSQSDNNAGENCCTALRTFFGRHYLLNQTYHRLMLGLSVFDILSSSGVTLFGAWSIPSDTYFVRGASASTHLWCNISGMLTQCFVVSMWYTISLMVYFLLLIKWEWRPQTIARRVEPWMHLVSIGVPMLLGLYAVVQGHMNPLQETPGRCWIVDYPPHCSTPESTVECIRGGAESRFLSWMLGWCTALPAFVTVVATMCLLYAKVRAVEDKLRNYMGNRLLWEQEESVNAGAGGDLSVATTSRATSSSTTSLRSNQQQQRRQQRRQFQRTREIALRGIVYSLAFGGVFVPGALLQVVEQPPIRANRTVYFALAFFFTALTPLQGVWNALVYLGTQNNHHSASGTRRTPSMFRWATWASAAGSSQSFWQSNASSSQVLRGWSTRFFTGTRQPPESSAASAETESSFWQQPSSALQVPSSSSRWAEDDNDDDESRRRRRCRHPSANHDDDNDENSCVDDDEDDDNCPLRDDHGESFRQFQQRVLCYSSGSPPLRSSFQQRPLTSPRSSFKKKQPPSIAGSPKRRVTWSDEDFSKLVQAYNEGRDHAEDLCDRKSSLDKVLQDHETEEGMDDTTVLTAPSSTTTLPEQSESICSSSSGNSSTLQLEGNSDHDDVEMGSAQLPNQAAYHDNPAVESTQEREKENTTMMRLAEDATDAIGKQEHAGEGLQLNKDLSMDLVEQGEGIPRNSSSAVAGTGTPTPSLKPILEVAQGNQIPGNSGHPQQYEYQFNSHGKQQY